MRRLGLKSVMIVPMVARGRTLGAITFAWAESGRRYNSIDLALAEELARRAALALDNALLYAEAQQLNTELENRVAVRTAQLETTNASLVSEIAERRQAEEQVRVLNAELEQRVAERTAQLEELNRDLKIEISERQTDQPRRCALYCGARANSITSARPSARCARRMKSCRLCCRAAIFAKRAARPSRSLTSRGPTTTPPQQCTILAAWNNEADLPAFVGQRLTLEDYGLIPPYSRHEPIVIEDIRTQRELSEPFASALKF